MVLIVSKEPGKNHFAGGTEEFTFDMRTKVSPFVWSH